MSPRKTKAQLEQEAADDAAGALLVVDRSLLIDAGEIAMAASRAASLGQAVDLPMPSFRRPSEAPWPGDDRHLADRPHLSPSQLKSWTGCGHRYYLERVVPPEDREPPLPAWALIGGRALHRAFDDIVADGLKGKPKEAGWRFRAHFAEEIAAQTEFEPDISKWRASGRASKAWPEKENRDWWAENGQAQVERFATLYDSPFLPGRVVVDNDRPLIEIGFTVEIGGEPVKGYIDAIVELPDGSIVPRDYKSGAKEEDGTQLATYAHAMHEIYGILPESGEYLMTRAMVVAPWDLRPLTREVIGREYAMLARAKEAGIYIPRPSSFCVACQVKKACVYRPQVEEAPDAE